MRVTGPRGSLTRDFKHTNVDIALQGSKKKSLVVEMWFGTRKELAAVRTVCSHVENMITGVTKVALSSITLLFPHCQSCPVVIVHHCTSFCFTFGLCLSRL